MAMWLFGARSVRLATLFLGSLATACAPPPAPVSRAGWTGAGSIEALLRGDAAALLQLQDLTAEVDFTLHKEGAAKGAFLFQPPSLLRLDVRGPLFQHLLTAVLDGERLTAVTGGKVYVLPAADGLDAFLDINLAGYDPRLALLGVVAPGTVDAVRYPRADRAEVTFDEGDGRRRRLWIDLHRGFVEREALLDVDDQILWLRQLSGWRQLPGTEVYLPRQIRLAAGERVLEIEMGQVRVNVGLEREAFYRGVPDGVPN